METRPQNLQMPMTVKRGRGRPSKASEDRLAGNVRVLLSNEQQTALKKFMDKHEETSESAAVRKILISRLKAEKFL